MVTDIGPGNGLLPDDTKPLPEPLRLCGIPWGNFTASAQATILYKEFENHTFKINATFPRGQSDVWEWK